MKIIFLDVDGVLNSVNNLIKVYNKTGKSHSGYNYPFDETCIELLRKLVLNTSAKIVITSTWRKNDKGLSVLLLKLKEYGLDKYILGYTPILGNRCEEIKKYLENFDIEVDYVILDDKYLEELSDNLIRTNRLTGLCDSDVEKAILKLNKKEN